MEKKRVWQGLFSARKKCFLFQAQERGEENGGSSKSPTAEKPLLPSPPILLILSPVVALLPPPPSSLPPLYFRLLHSTPPSTLPFLHEKGEAARGRAESVLPPTAPAPLLLDLPSLQPLHVTDLIASSSSSSPPSTAFSFARGLAEGAPSFHGRDEQTTGMGFVSTNTFVSLRQSTVEAN